MELHTTAPSASTTIDIPRDEQSSFALAGIVAGVSRGTVVAHFPAGGVEGVDGSLCNYRHQGDSYIEWSSGTTAFGDWRSELGEIFFDALASRGVNVKGDPSNLFDASEDVFGAEYLIAGRIEEIRGNYCEAHNFWTGDPMDIYSGEMYVRVNWTIRSSVTNTDVARFETDGYFKQKELKRNGILITFHNAFADAAERMLERQEFVDVATGDIEEKNAVVEVGSELILPRLDLSDRTFKSNPSRVIDSGVTVRLGQAHGSGFFISTDGYIMTNAHVVSSARKVAIQLSNGLEVEGEVLRRDTRRDVALIKVPLRVPNALPIRFETVEILEEVYAVSSPLLTELQSTVTAGVVSARRFDEKLGIQFIQSDVAITGGNSGGPFVDKNGNVVGLTVASYIGGNSLNLFIPIEDGLRTLNISMTGPAS